MRPLIPLLALLTVLAACSSSEEPDDGPDATTSAAEPVTGEPAPASCARVSATDLSGWLGAEVTISDGTEDAGVVSCTGTGDGTSFVSVEWTLAATPPPPETAPDSVTQVSAEGRAEDGRTVTATAVRFHPLSEVTDAALQSAVDNVVAAYAVPGAPTLTGDPCRLVPDADVSAWAGFPIEVRDVTSSGRDDLLCRTVVGDEGGDNAFATLEWRLTPPRQTLTVEAGPVGRDPQTVTLPGGRPAVMSYDDDFRLAVVAAEAGETTVVVEVSGDVLSDEDEYSAERIQDLALAVADVYAR